MYNFDMTPFAEMIKRDEQLLIALNEWDGKTSSLYKDNLPAAGGQREYQTTATNV